MAWDTRKLLALDSSGGLLAGAMVLLLHRELSTLENLPQALLFMMGATNVAYGAYSGSLRYAVVQSLKVPRFFFRLLVCANAAWSLVCLGLAWNYWGQSTWFGKVHLVGEALIVGGLAWVENQVFFSVGPAGKAS